MSSDSGVSVSPRIDPTAWVAPGAWVLGDTRVGARSSVWFSAVVRSDLATITLGIESNLQDGSVVHADPGFPVIIGDQVSIGHRSVLHGCTIGDRTLIGMGAIVMNGSEIGTGAIVAAGSLVVQGTTIPDGCLAMGSPARVVRETTESERAGIATNAAEYVALMSRYRKALDASTTGSSVTRAR
jgi:carbonic anhydrase/acetyltransferase-like protein (isoleucine patch superfamily)